jgi:hypothetical protein
MAHIFLWAIFLLYFFITNFLIIFNYHNKNKQINNYEMC